LYYFPVESLDLRQTKNAPENLRHFAERTPILIGANPYVRVQDFVVLLSWEEFGFETN